MSTKSRASVVLEKEVGQYAERSLFVCLATRQNDYQLYINGKLESLVCSPDTPKIARDPIQGVKLKKHEMLSPTVALFKIVPFVDQTNSIKSYYDMNKSRTDQEVIPVDSFKKDQTFYNYYTRQLSDTLVSQALAATMTGTPELRPDAGYEYKKFNFELFVSTSKALLEEFGLEKHPFFPAAASVFERKISVKNIRTMLKNYEFLYSLISMVSPTVGVRQSVAAAIAYLPLQEKVGSDKGRYQTPFAPIALNSFKRCVQRFFQTDQYMFDVIVALLKATPYYLGGHLSSDKDVHCKNVIIYDKALFLLRRLFLTEKEQCRVTEGILSSGSYCTVSIHEDEEFVIKRLFAIAGVQLPTKVALRALFPDIFEVNYDEELSAAKVAIDENWHVATVCKIEQVADGQVKLALTGKGGQVQETVLRNYSLRSTLPAEFACKAIRSVTLCADMREVYKIVIQTPDEKIKVQSKNYDKQSKHTRPHQKYQINFPLGLSAFHFVLSGKDSSILGCIFASPIDPLTPRPDSFAFLDPILSLLPHCVNPEPYDLSAFYDLALRFDINTFSKTEYELNHNTVSLIKYKPNEYISNAKVAKSVLESMFPKSLISFNSFGTVKIGELKVYLKGLFRTQFSCTNEIELYCNSDGNPSFDFVEVYERLCCAVIENFPLDSFVDAQNKYFEQLKLSMTSLRPLNEEEVSGGKAAASRTTVGVTLQVVCNNYGCSEAYEAKENHSRCKGHPGTWDFGHTGVKIESAITNANSLLWKPHWTCCGKGWGDQCSSFHFHETKENRVAIDLEDPFSQRVFKKNIRQNWMNKIKRMQNISEKQLRKRISQFCSKNGCKVEVSS